MKSFTFRFLLLASTVFTAVHARAFWGHSVNESFGFLSGFFSSLRPTARKADSGANIIKFATLGGKAELFINGKWKAKTNGPLQILKEDLNKNDVIAFKCTKTNSGNKNKKAGLMATVSYDGKIYRTGTHHFTSSSGFSKWKKWERKSWNAVKDYKDKKTGERHGFCHWKKANTIVTRAKKFDKHASFIWKTMAELANKPESIAFIRFVIGGENCPVKPTKGKSDEDDDEADDVAKGKRKQGDDDDDNDGKSKRKKNKGGDDDDDDGKDKRKKNKGGDDDDDNDGKGKRKKNKGDDDDDDDDDDDGKGKPKKNKGGDDDDDDDDGKGKRRKNKGGDDDDDDNSKGKRKNKNDDGKGKRRENKGGDDDDDDNDDNNVKDKRTKDKGGDEGHDDDDGKGKHKNNKEDGGGDDDKNKPSGRVPHPKDHDAGKNGKPGTTDSLSGQSDGSKPDGFCACEPTPRKGGECYDIEEPSANSGRCKPRPCEPKFECVATGAKMCVKRRGGSKVVMVSPNKCMTVSSDDVEMLLPYEG